MHTLGCVFVKNPYRSETTAGKYGTKNALIKIEDKMLAVRLAGENSYITRLVVPEYQRKLSALFDELKNEVDKSARRDGVVITGRVYSR